MGLLDKVLGNAQEASDDEVKDVLPLLLEGEYINRKYVVGARDLFVLTPLRLILVDKTGLSGKKMVRFRCFLAFLCPVTD